MEKKDNKKYYLFELNITILNIVSLVLFGLVFLLCNILFPKTADIARLDFILVFALYIVFMLLHEILHSISYVLHGAKLKKIVYGAYIEKGVLYCLCKQNITRKNILNSLLFPFFYIGIVTLVIALTFDLPTLLYLSIFNISGCAGDLVMFTYISKLNKNIEFSEFDNPIQFAIQSNEDVSKIKHFGLNFIKETNSISRTIDKKISVSKGSIILAILLIIMFVIYLIFV